MRGTLNDWKLLKEKISKLNDYGAPDGWVKALEIIADNFIKTYEEKPNLDFWE